MLCDSVDDVTSASRNCLWIQKITNAAPYCRLFEKLTVQPKLRKEPPRSTPLYDYEKEALSVSTTPLLQGLWYMPFRALITYTLQERCLAYHMELGTSTCDNSVAPPSTFFVACVDIQNRFVCRSEQREHKNERRWLEPMHSVMVLREQNLIIWISFTITKQDGVFIQVQGLVDAPQRNTAMVQWHRAVMDNSGPWKCCSLAHRVSYRGGTLFEHFILYTVNKGHCTTYTGVHSTSQPLLQKGRGRLSQFRFTPKASACLTYWWCMDRAPKRQTCKDASDSLRQYASEYTKLSHRRSSLWHTKSHF